MVKFRPISDQILREIQTKSDHFLGKFGLCAQNNANFGLLPDFRPPTMSRTLKKLVAVGGGSLVILVFILRDEQNYIQDKFRLRLRLLFQGFWGVISLEIEKIGVSEQIQTKFGLIFAEQSEFGPFPKIRTKVGALTLVHPPSIPKLIMLTWVMLCQELIGFPDRIREIRIQ